MPLVLRSLGISAQHGIHEISWKFTAAIRHIVSLSALTWSSHITRQKSVNPLSNKSRAEMPAEASPAELKGFPEGKKIKIKPALLFPFLKMTSMYLSPKDCNHALWPHGTIRRFSGCPEYNSLHQVPFLTIFCFMLYFRGQGDWDGSGDISPNKGPVGASHVPLGRWIIFCPAVSAASPLLSSVQQRLFHREGHSQFTAENLYSVFGGGGKAHYTSASCSGFVWLLSELSNESKQSL